MLLQYQYRRVIPQYCFKTVNILCVLLQDAAAAGGFEVIIVRPVNPDGVVACIFTALL